MARAKRTQRAEARRRYRAANNLEEPVDLDEGPASSPTRAASSSATGSPKPSARVGMTTAFRASFRPLNIREDIAALPTLVLSTALWVPVLIIIAGTVMIASSRGGSLGLFAFENFLEAPVIPAFIAGLLAKRASWLIGAFVGLAAAAGYAIVLLYFPTSISTTVPTQTQVPELVVRAFVTAPIWGAFFAAAAAWYRRFLRLSSPNRARQASKGPQKKAGDGRTRTAGTSQKAPAKR